ncbi:hypothetical protein GCM10018952_59210 [Streptosporangium vulgare]
MPDPRRWPGTGPAPRRDWPSSGASSAGRDGREPRFPAPAGVTGGSGHVMSRPGHVGDSGYAGALFMWVASVV